SSSHYVLRDVLGMDADGNLTSKFWDGDSDGEGAGMPIPGMRRGSQQQQQQQQPQQRGAITPFASGSLPKGSGEFARGLRGRPSTEFGNGGTRGRPSGEYAGGAGKDDEYNLGGYEN